MYRKRSLVLIAMSLFVFHSSLAISSSADNLDKPNQKRDKLLGNLIKNALETYHYRDAKVNLELSKQAFDEFLKRLDFRKQFLHQSDIKILEKHREQMANQLVSGNHLLIQEAMKIMSNRLSEAEAFRKKSFKKSFSFESDGSLELDPEKRDWPKNKKEFEAYWRALFKYDVVNRFIALRRGEDSSTLISAEGDSGPGLDQEGVTSAPDGAKQKKSDEVKDSEKVAEVPAKSDEELKKEAIEAISKKYERIFSRLSEDKFGDYLERFVNSISLIFDPHTSYLPPQRREDFDIDISGSLEGIGAVLQEDGDFIKVVQVVPGGPAWRQQKLEVDDVILWVSQADEEKQEQVELVGMRVGDAVRHIRGPKGSTVNLMVRKPDGTQKLIPIERDVIQVGATYARSSILEHEDLDAKIGYIHLPKFYRDFGNGDRNCTDDVRRELNRLKSQEVDAVVLDLRNNGGGALEDARQMSGLFINEGPIVQIRDHRGNIDVLRDTSKEVVYDGPLVVLINRFSASASEILAGALQDYGRAIVIGGEYTHGKGTVQAVLDLNRNPIANIFSGGNFGALKVTIQKFYRVTGGSTQFKGITPDIILPDPFGYTRSREQDLDYALPWESVEPLQFKPWTKGAYNVSLLQERSEKRVKRDDRFEKIRNSVAYFTERRNDTLVSLNKAKNIKRDEENRKITEKFRLDEKNEKIKVSFYEPSLRENSNIREEDMEQWKEDLKLRADEWIGELQKDPTIEEAIFIVDDMIRINRGKKLGMITVDR